MTGSEKTSNFDQIFVQAIEQLLTTNIFAFFNLALYSCKKIAIRKWCYKKEDLEKLMLKVNVQDFHVLPHTYVELHVTFLRSELFNRSECVRIFTEYFPGHDYLISVHVTTKMDAKQVAYF